MNAATVRAAVGDWFATGIRGWDRFWFTPTSAEVLGLIRIGTGAMLLYMHLVLATDLLSFLGPDAWIDNDTARSLHDGTFGLSDAGRSYLWHLQSPAAIWTHHLLTIATTFCFMIGLGTRVTAPLAWFFQLMIVHRLTGCLFGLDQIATYAAMYLMPTRCGSCYSVDAWLRDRKGTVATHRVPGIWFPANDPVVGNTIATRLFQIHLCVIYLFGGLAKARGEQWWDGTATWFAIANYEYQSIDVTFLAGYPLLFSLLTHVTLFWEIFYVALIWPRWTRPVALGLAVLVHSGIAIFLGMATFGMMMIIANMIFLRPRRVDGDSSEPPAAPAATATGVPRSR